MLLVSEPRLALADVRKAFKRSVRLHGMESVRFCALTLILKVTDNKFVDRVSVVSIAIPYGMEVPGIKSWW